MGGTGDELRPLTWDDYIGQAALKEHLQIKIAGALDRGESLSHVLLHGPPGVGKTTLAALIAQEMKSDFLSYVMPIKQQVLKRAVQQFEGVLLLDEIHRMGSKDEQDLLPVLHEGFLQCANGVRIYCGDLTVVGATTRPDKLDEALWDRFIIKPPFEVYSDGEMGQIVTGMANRVGLEIPTDVAVKLGRATGGVPRNGQALVGMARDLKSLDVDLILSKCGLTADGLSFDHLKYLTILADAGAPVGIEMLTACMDQPKMVVVRLEKLLRQRGMIEQTKQGRNILGPGFKAIGIKLHL